MAIETPTPPSQPAQENIQPNMELEQHGKKRTSEKATKKSKKTIAVDGKEDYDEDDVDKTRWSNTQVVQLIHFRSEMDIEFAIAVGKQGNILSLNHCIFTQPILYFILTHCNLTSNGVGVNTWFKVHRHMLVACPRFQKSHSACKKKWDVEYKKYKEDKRFLQISSNNRHIQCKFFEEIDMAFANRANVKKLVHHDSEGGSNPCPVDGADDVAPTAGEGASSRASNKEPPIAALCSERKEAKRSTVDRLCDLLGDNYQGNACCG